ncbi:MAG: KOW motif-containing protein, partial [Eubacteriaceae bacterium]|nr:KOW motif-containing protein [Eubacteriaceae bacterium]
MIKMFITDDSWYVVRNTRGVTGFVGPASKPVPLTKAELKSMGIRQQRVEISMHVGEEVKVTEGPLEGFTGIIEEVHSEKSKVKVNVSMFGRETLAELGFEQIEKLKA